MTTQLTRFTQWARERPQRSYNSLLGMLFDPAGLNASYERQAANKASGVDGVRKVEYGGDGLTARLGDLSARVRRLTLVYTLASPAWVDTLNGALWPTNHSVFPAIHRPHSLPCASHQPRAPCLLLGARSSHLIHRDQTASLTANCIFAVDYHEPTV